MQDTQERTQMAILTLKKEQIFKKGGAEINRASCLHKIVTNYIYTYMQCISNLCLLTEEETVSTFPMYVCMYDLFWLW